MKIHISLSEDSPEKKEDDSAKAAPPAGFGTDYSNWEDRMRKTKAFKEIKRLDRNKLAAYDQGGNIIESFVIKTDRMNMKTDTLDSEQKNAPIEKTQGDVRVDAKMEKGA
jgi:hypothetical protein